MTEPWLDLISFGLDHHRHEVVKIGVAASLYTRKCCYFTYLLRIEWSINRASGLHKRNLQNGS